MLPNVLGDGIYISLYAGNQKLKLQDGSDVYGA